MVVLQNILRFRPYIKSEKAKMKALKDDSVKFRDMNKLADEPTGALDEESSKEILSLFR